MRDNKFNVKVCPQGTSVIVDFGDIALYIPTNLKGDISIAKIDEEGIVYLDVNRTEDFLSITAIVFGEPPNYRPFIYNIIKDTKNMGERGLRKLVRTLF